MPATERQFELDDAVSFDFCGNTGADAADDRAIAVGAFSVNFLFAVMRNFAGLDEARENVVGVECFDVAIALRMQDVDDGQINQIRARL